MRRGVIISLSALLLCSVPSAISSTSRGKCLTKQCDTSHLLLALPVQYSQSHPAAPLMVLVGEHIDTAITRFCSLHSLPKRNFFEPLRGMLAPQMARAQQLLRTPAVEVQLVVAQKEVTAALRPADSLTMVVFRLAAAAGTPLDDANDAVGGPLLRALCDGGVGTGTVSGRSSAVSRIEELLLGDATRRALDLSVLRRVAQNLITTNHQGSDQAAVRCAEVLCSAAEVVDRELSAYPMCVGISLHSQAQHKESITAFQRAAALSPHDASIYINLATAATHVPGAEARALFTKTSLRGQQLLRQEVQRTGAAATVLKLTGMLITAINHGGGSRDRQLAEAQQLLAQAVAASPQSVAVHQKTAELHSAAAEHRAAVHAYKKAVSFSPRSASLSAALGHAYLMVDTPEYQKAGMLALRRAMDLGQWTMGDASVLGSAVRQQEGQRAADAVYAAAAAHGVWKHAEQHPSQVYDAQLEAKPWWDNPAQFDFVRTLEQQWGAIAKEFKSILNQQLFAPNEVQSIVKDGRGWDEFGLFRLGKRNESHCDLAPVTCQVVESLKEAVGEWRGWPIQGEAEFLLLRPGARLSRHCGVTNRRLTAHLGLVTPPGPVIQVGNVSKVWQEGKVLLFDDSFEHEVWHDGTQPRGVLYISVWHPALWPELTTSR